MVRDEALAQKTCLCSYPLLSLCCSWHGRMFWAAGLIHGKECRAEPAGRRKHKQPQQPLSVPTTASWPRQWRQLPREASQKLALQQDTAVGSTWTAVLPISLQMDFFGSSGACLWQIYSHSAQPGYHHLSALYYAEVMCPYMKTTPEWAEIVHSLIDLLCKSPHPVHHGEDAPFHIGCRSPFCDLDMWLCYSSLQPIEEACSQ